MDDLTKDANNHAGAESGFNAGLGLLPCPFCGGEAHLTHGPRGMRAECKKRFDGCNMNMRTHHQITELEAINAWNTRA